MWTTRSKRAKQFVLLFIGWLTRSATVTVELMYSRNLLPPIVPPFVSSFSTVCTQHAHTSGDWFLWRLPVIALCRENETREWEGVEGIRLEGDGWINVSDVCYFLPLFVFDSLMVHISHYSPFFLFQWPLSLLISFPPLFECNSGKLGPFVFISLFQPSVLSDYSGAGPVKASPIILFKQHCSLALCSSETRLFSICSLYYTNTWQLCLFSSDRKFKVLYSHRPVTDHYFWRPLKIFF